ncbi:MAG: dockerin type I domain-containing protein [Bacteroidales bacterium]
MNRLYIFLFFIVLGGYSYSQKTYPTSITSGGDFFCTSDVSLAVSIGDPIMDSYFTDGSLTTLGFNQPSLINVQGKLSYLIGQNTPLPNSTIWIQRNNYIIRTSITDEYGNYLFSDLIPGNYILVASTEHSFGGINSADALIALKHFVHMVTLSGLALQAADVDGNGIVNASDAMSITRRFNGFINSFPVGDWQFEAPGFSIGPHGNYFQNIHALCTGDVNGSYIPQ